MAKTPKSAKTAGSAKSAKTAKSAKSAKSAVSAKSAKTAVSSSIPVGPLTVRATPMLAERNEGVHVGNTVSLHRVIARDGLNLRSGPGTDFLTIKSLPFGTAVNVMSRDGPWALVDLIGDGAADGHVHASFLEEVSPIGDG
jgi:hypothetical protein